jgi:hypothetical protein
LLDAHLTDHQMRPYRILLIVLNKALVKYSQQMDLSFIFYNAHNTIVADAPATYVNVIAVFTILVALLFIMRE